MIVGARSGFPIEIGKHRALLVKTDDTPSWAEGHADWLCERCGQTAPKSTALAELPCIRRD